jgi:hypothetical protein
VISSRPRKPTRSRRHRPGHSPARQRSTTPRPHSQARSAPRVSAPPVSPQPSASSVSDSPAISSPAAASPPTQAAGSPESLSAPSAQAVPAPRPATTYSGPATASPDNRSLAAGPSGDNTSTAAPSTQVESPRTVSDPVNGSDKDFDRSIDNIIDQEMRRYGQGGGN